MIFQTIRSQGTHNVSPHLTFSLIAWIQHCCLSEISRNNCDTGKLSLAMSLQEVSKKDLLREWMNDLSLGLLQQIPGWFLTYLSPSLFFVSQSGNQNNSFKNISQSVSLFTLSTTSLVGFPYHSELASSK